ncbi:acyl-CoA thioester hydrolase [Helicobacter enhydrae]|uniref:Acyl-CoA thioester hydrolase n=1 Tax=Helicobacter enhydrae TaxID=222136 RepID=A0A1B1U6N8_9HELI|nr:YbgC/FadM family acyl-CoA thioesterase [Helicobacter enhydrae]ANV98410.1 acyl-CoA thioester hydrolase [Helicobacter enhydrae]
MQVRVYYEDTDCGGIVYHANFLKFCERGRSEVFFEDGKMPCNAEIGFVVRKIEADFLQSAKLGDILEVKTEILELKKASLLLSQRVYKGEEKLFDMRVKMGCVSITSGKPSVIPEEFMEVLRCKL